LHGEGAINPAQLVVQATRWLKGWVLRNTRGLKKRLAKPRTPFLDHVIVGGGFAATATYVTRKGNGGVRGRCALLASEVEPWNRLEHWPLGQPASELVSEAFPVQPQWFAHEASEFCPSAAFSGAISVAQRCHRAPLHRLLVHAIDVDPRGRFRVALEAGRLHARHVDIASGRGPARRLRPGVMSRELADALCAAGVMILADATQLATYRPTGRVLVIGGGATGAWFAARAGLEAAEDVVWLARARPWDAWEGELEGRVQRLTALLRNPPVRLRRERLKRWLDRLEGFRLADVARNRTTFQNRRITRLVGDVVQVSAVGGRVRVQWERESGSGIFDQLVVALGQEADVPPGPRSLIQSIKGLRLLSMEVSSRSVRCLDSFDPAKLRGERLLGLATPSGNLRVLGAAAVPPWPNVELSESQRMSVEKHYFGVQLACAAKHSKGIPGSIYQASIDIALANGYELDATLGEARLTHASLRAHEA
jgi:hypothetical protein